MSIDKLLLDRCHRGKIQLSAPGQTPLSLANVIAARLGFQRNAACQFKNVYELRIRTVKI